MSDLPSDARTRLVRLLSEAESAARARDEATVRERLADVDATLAESVPAGDLREQLRHGSRRVDALVADEPLVAAAYCEAMRRRVEDRL